MDTYELRQSVLSHSPAAKKKFRQRKRDWPQTVYKFWARPLDKLPDQIWTQARDMNQLWNDLLELRKTAQEEAASLQGDKKKARWSQFNIDSKALVKSSALNWECKAAVADRFTTAARRAVKEHSELHFRGGIRKVNIPHRYTGGGADITRLFSEDSSAKRLRVYPVKADAYINSKRINTRRRLTRGVFGLAEDVQFEFETIVHRSIPAGSIVKQANWCGIFDRNLPFNRRWTWSLQFVCEVPPERFFKAPAPDLRGVCAIDIGWRLIDGEFLRIGMVVDNGGRTIELRLPLFMAKKRDVDKKDYYTSFYDLLELDSKIGIAVENAKAAILKHLGGKPQGFDKMRQRGIRKLIDEAEEGELKTALEQWNNLDRKLNMIKAAVMGRMKRRKTYLYQNIAAWLTDNYKTIVLESDLDLKKLGMEEGGPAIDNAAKYRQWAGLGEFRTLLKNAAARSVSELVGVKCAYSTVQCHVCGADSESDRAKLWMECPNGHRWDQDINAARNLLSSQTSRGNAQNISSRKMAGDANIKALEIPAALKTVAVPCSAQ